MSLVLRQPNLAACPSRVTLGSPSKDMQVYTVYRGIDDSTLLLVNECVCVSVGSVAIVQGVARLWLKVAGIGSMPILYSHYSLEHPECFSGKMVVPLTYPLCEINDPQYFKVTGFERHSVVKTSPSGLSV